jgi:hypothetical protein
VCFRLEIENVVVGTYLLICWSFTFPIFFGCGPDVFPLPLLIHLDISNQSKPIAAGDLIHNFLGKNLKEETGGIQDPPDISGRYLFILNYSPGG